MSGNKASGHSRTRLGAQQQWLNILACGCSIATLFTPAALRAQTQPGFLGACTNPAGCSDSSTTSQQQQSTDMLMNGQGTYGTQQSQYGTMPSMPQGTRDQYSTTPYVDRAGTNPSQTTPRQLQALFPPDPITDLQRLARSSTGELLPVFGRDLFQNAPSTFAPGDQLAVTADYIVGAGDQVLLRLWGPETFNSELTVDQSGSVYIPKVGAVHVAGLRFDELQQQLTTAVSRVYRNFNLSVNLGRLRSIQIYVVGEARRPGAYTVSSLSTVLNALFASGGPSVIGSMRHIQVRRGTTTLPEFDLYNLVLRGDKSRDIRLENGDTIFIPPVGPQVALGGSVRHPALYELASGSTVQDVITLAGGFSAVGADGSIALERIGTDLTRHSVTVALDAAGRTTPLKDGDVMYAGHISAGYEQTVTIRGNLANPGRFAWHQGMRLHEIIPDRMSLLTNNYWRERSRLGVPVPLFEPLPQTQQRATRLPVAATGTTSGANGAGLYPTTPQSTAAAGRSSYYNQQNAVDPGYVDPLLTDSTALQADVLASRTTADDARSIGQVGPAISGVTAAPDALQQATGTAGTNGQPVGVAGSNYPSPAQPTATSDITPVNRIQIPAPEINWTYAAIERLNPTTLKSSVVAFNLGRLVQDHDAAQDLELQPGDIVTILSEKDVPVPLDAQTKLIRLEGEFASPGVYSTLPGETLTELVRRAGGFSPKAYLYGSSFLRESARVFQQQRLDEYISHLSTDMERSLAVRAVSSSTGILDPTSLAEQRSLIAQLRAMRATGRVVLNFTPDSAGIDAVPPIPLENGDSFRVPSVPGTVSVIGAVYGQNVFLYNPQSHMQNYLALAGKPNRIADRKAAFIIRADGSVYSREQANSVFSNKFDNARINPGDSIVVPEKLIKPTVLRQLTDYSQILSSFGLAAAAINVVR